MEQKNELASYVENISVLLLGILFAIFPLFFTYISTSPLMLPKQALLGAVVGILLILQIIKTFAEKSIRLRRTVFDIPILLLAFAALLSAAFATNRADSLVSFAPFFFATALFFLTVNIGKDKNSFIFLLASVVTGGTLLSILAVLSFFKIYILPFTETHSQIFTPLGSSLEQGIYLVIIFAASSYYLYRFLKVRVGKSENAHSHKISGQETIRAIGFGVASFIILLGIIVTAYISIKLNKPIVLPVETGFQTALSAISLDSSRVAQGFLFGSGIGTYATDFLRWKQISFNQNQELWGLIFYRSSNFALELLATTGVLGLSAFIFLLLRIIKEVRVSPQNKIVISVIGFLVAVLLLPLNFPTQTLLFIILGLFAVNQGLMSKTQNRFFDVELHLVAFKKGIIAVTEPHARSSRSLILPSIATVIILAIIGVLGYYSVLYVSSDLIFKKSLAAASQENGMLTYNLQREAISIYPYKDVYYRVFSQTNFAIANSLAAQQEGEASPNQEIQQNISVLIQQSINSARNATAIAPATNLNWQNLSSIYKNLIGFGENAENFAIASAQQSISLDPNNPQEYIFLGGIYYQLGQWDNAQSQFQIAISLKPDFANSYYNLGHTLEQKGDLQNALVQYQTVKSLVTNDKTSLEQIDKEIAALQNKIPQQGTANTDNSTNEVNETLNINEPTGQLPEQNPPIEIPGPDIATESSS